MASTRKKIRIRDWLGYSLNHPYQIITLFLLITALFALQLPRLTFETSIYDMAIEDLPEMEKYREFKKAFGCDELILVVVKTPHVFEPATFQRVEALSRTLSGLPGIRQAISLPGIKKDMELTGEWTLEEFEAVIAPVDLFRRNLISEDGKTTAITLILEDITRKDRVIRAVETVLEGERNGMTLYQIGMPLVSKALAEYTEQDFMMLPPLAFGVICLILFALFRSVRGILLPAGSVLMALVWTFGSMALSGTPLSMLTMIVPIFVIAVGTAYCMYLLPEYLEAARETGSSREAARACLLRVGFPTTLAVITTSIGLGSLLVNRIQSIRDFAVFSCVGIWSMLFILLVFLPAVLSVLPRPLGGRRRGVLKSGWMASLLDGIVHLNLHRQKITLPVIGGMALFGLLGIFLLKVETNPVGFFQESTPISRHFHDVYQDMAGSFPINVVLNSREADHFEDPKHLETLNELQMFLGSLDGVDKTISFADYFKLVNYASNQYRPEFYTLPEEGFEVRMLMNNFKTMLGRDMFERFMTPDLSTANILLRTHISSSEDFLSIRKRIAEHLETAFPASFEFQVTGFGVVISQSSKLLTRGQVRSLSLTLILIFIIMFGLFLSFKVGFYAILPNLFPIVMNFGIMGWAGIELSVATSLIASIAIGLAVDDTIHYLFRYNQEFKADLVKERALRDTIHSVGRPILFTTLTIGAGFSMLMFSHFRPSSVFGLMMVITMVSALLADLILLPSLMTHVELVTVWDLLRLKMGKDPREGISLFDGLSRKQAHYILMAGTLVDIKSGGVLFLKGETSDSMYAVISGELEVVDIQGDQESDDLFGTKKLINNIRKGDVVGEMGMVRSCLRSATVIATENSLFLKINDRMIRRLHWLYPPTAQKFFFNLMSIICNRLEYTTQCLTDVTISDALTGLHNREHFMHLVDQELNRMQRYGSEFSVCLLDLDNFKGLNHTYGHETGDLVLKEVGRFVALHARKSDQTCRFSGQQFALLLVNVTSEQARKTCERLLLLLSEHLLEIGESKIFITASVGFATVRPGLSQSSDELLAMAAQALRKAKNSGKNRVEEHG